MTEGDAMYESGHTRRGWWDYVPERPRSEQVPPASRASPGPSRRSSEHSGIIRYVGSKLHSLWSYPPPDSPSLHRKPSIPGDLPISQPGRTSSVTFSVHRAGQAGRGSLRVPVAQRLHVPPPPSPSAMSRLSKYMPRMQLFKRVLKDEVRMSHTVSRRLLTILRLPSCIIQHSSPSSTLL